MALVLRDFQLPFGTALTARAETPITGVTKDALSRHRARNAAGQGEIPT